MSAPVTMLEALEDMIDQLTGSGFADREGRPLETTQVYQNALRVLDDRRPRESSSFAPAYADRSRH